jgi:hypothetical protein
MKSHRRTHLRTLFIACLLLITAAGCARQEREGDLPPPLPTPRGSLTATPLPAATAVSTATPLPTSAPRREPTIVPTAVGVTLIITAPVAIPNSGLPVAVDLVLRAEGGVASAALVDLGGLLLLNPELSQRIGRPGGAGADEWRIAGFLDPLLKGGAIRFMVEGQMIDLPWITGDEQATAPEYEMKTFELRP